MAGKEKKTCKKKTEKPICEEVTEEVKDTACECENQTEETKESKNEANEANEAKEEKSPLDIAKEQVSALSDKLMRLAAEFDNFKKRTAREKDDFYKTSVCDVVEPFLAVLDNLSRATEATDENGSDGLADGVKMIKKQFEEVLTSIGVKEIEAVGNEFDPELHNAVMTGESDMPENTVIEEFQKGYIYKDKVIRHSMVKVSN